MNTRDPAYPNRAEWLTRPARKQVDDATLQKEIQARGGLGERNLWSGRRMGPPGPGGDGKRGGPGGQRVKDAAKYRCILELDVGRTRGSDAKQHVFCLYFAKGCCSQGSACTYLHRLPTAEDEAYAVRDLSADIFGREKRAESEGFRKGAGTLERDNRTLYVNYEGAGSYELPKVRQLLEANFRAFGPVNNIYIVHNKTIAFVRYDWRSSAEFAKEAMNKQGLVGSTMGEVITARWSNEDPNPVAVLAQKRACEEAFGLAVASSFEALPPEQKQARIMQLQTQSALQRGAAIGFYPSTDGQFEERERQQQVLEQQQQEQGPAGEDDEDIPYIPPDIYEEQQRLAVQRSAQVLAQPKLLQPLPQLQAQGQQGGGAGPHGPGSTAGAEGEGAGTSGGAAASGGATGAGGSEAPEWEKAWTDPELREQMRSNPELRERMRRQRNEAVYWSAYQAHYTAYATSYGHQAWEQQEQQGQGYQQGYPQGYVQGQEYAWHEWYGQQGVGEAGGDGGGAAAAAVGLPETGYGAAAGYGASGAGYGGHDRQAEAEGGPAAGQGQDGAAGSSGSAGGTGEDDGRGMGSGETKQGDGLTLLGAAYGSDEED